MTKEELQHFMIETACKLLQVECENFSNFYKHEGLEVEYDLHDQDADIYLIDNGEKEKIFTLDFIGAVRTWRYGPDLIAPHFEKINQKYKLEEKIFGNRQITQPEVNNDTKEV